MENKNIRKLVGGGVARSTAIDLKTIDAEVAALAGRSPRTPIGMKELWDEVQNLKATAKSWEIVTLNKSGSNSYTFDSKYSAYNFVVIAGQLSHDINRDQTATFTIGQNSISFNARWSSSADNYYLCNSSFSYSKSGNSIICNREVISSTITVLFYK